MPSDIPIQYTDLLAIREIAERYAGQRLPALDPARLAKAYLKLLSYPVCVPRNEFQWIMFEIDAGIRSKDRGKRAFLRAFHWWKHGSGSSEWNSRYAARRARLYQFARRMGMIDDRYN